MNKKPIIIGILAALALAAAIVGVFAYFNNSGNVPQDNTPVATPTPAEKMKEAHESVIALLTINNARTAVTMELTGLNGRYDGVSYELRYNSDQGEKGAVGGLRTPIPLEDGADTFERDIELGTCSTGGKCRYDKGVKNFSLTIKLHTIEGEVEVLQKTFAEL